MRRRDEREIARRLERFPGGEPPPELLERLKDDLADDLAGRLAEGGEEASRPTRRRWLAAAATVVMVVGGGWLAWSLWQVTPPLDESVVDGLVSARSEPERADAGAAREAAQRDERAGTGGAARQESDLPEARAAEVAEKTTAGETVVEPLSEPVAGEEGSPPPEVQDRAQEGRPETDAAPFAAGEEPVGTPGPAPTEPSGGEVRTGGAAAADPVLQQEPVPEDRSDTPGRAVAESEESERGESLERSGTEPTKAAASEARGPRPGREPAEEAAPGALAPQAESEVRAPAPHEPEAGERSPAPVQGEARRRAASDAAPGTSPRGVLLVRTVAPDGPPLPGVTVLVLGKAATERWTTNAAGEAVFDSLPAGRYRVVSRLQGFETAQASRVRVRAGRIQEIELTMDVRGVAEEITVYGKVGESGTTSASRSATQDAASRRSRRAAPFPDPAPPGALAEVVPARLDPRPRLPAVSTFVDTATDPLSTFGLDVDTGSYTAVRRILREGRRPAPGRVRVEEMVNALRYADPFAGAPPAPGETFRVTVDAAPYPFAPGPRHRLLRFRVAARPVVKAERRPAALTLVVDVSGSMAGARLALVKEGVRHLLGALEPTDSVALVTFSTEAHAVAAHGDPASLAAAVDALATGGGTNAAAGLALGYEKAAGAYREGAVNRVILLSDGLANRGATEADALLERVAEHAGRGIELTTVGVGMFHGDALLEQLADRGDGRYLYADGPEEMERAFVEELTGTLQTVAEEARAQVEISPRSTVRWRLLGYENRAIADERFRWDHEVDGGEVGAGQAVTVLYEVELAEPVPEPGDPLALLKLRWRDPGEERFRESEHWLRAGDVAASWEAASADLRLAATVAELGEVLRRSPHAADPRTVLREARRLATDRPDDEQVEELVELAERVVALADCEREGEAP